MTIRGLLLAVLAAGMFVLPACGDEGGGGGPDASSDTDTDVDTDSDTDADGDSDCEDAWYDSASGLSWEISPTGNYTDLRP